MHVGFSRQLATCVLATLLVQTHGAFAVDVDAGYNVYSAAQAMVNLASHSWEWGTAAEALLELYTPELSVFGTDPFPEGKVPKADVDSTFALQYAKQYIHVNGQVFVNDSAVGDPASLGVSALLIGQSDQAYLDASDRQADYILNEAPKYSNGAISHRPDVAEVWADNMAMSFPFLAYLAVQRGDTDLMAATVTQCGLQRDVLKTSQHLNWQHIIGPQSQDTGLWATGNGWAGFGMVRVLHTLQKWPGSASTMTSQASQLKSWIKEILDGALASGFDGGLLHNYLDDASWFGEISGTALLSAVAYRMAVNDPITFPQKYITWADTNRNNLAKHQSQGGSGIFSPAVNPYNWKDQSKYTSGSPEGQAFMVLLYAAYRDCVVAGICAKTTSPSVITYSSTGIGPQEVVTMLQAPITYSAMPAPTDAACGPPQSCDANGCNGSFKGIAKYATCQAGPLAGCQCTPTNTTCGAHQSCDLNGCAGAFNGLKAYAQCTGNFLGCECTATTNTCGAHQSCDLNGCAGAFDGLQQYAQCTGNFIGCQCTATANTCGDRQSCDKNNCKGKFIGVAKYPQCTGNFIGCECWATDNTCGNRQSCDLNGCAGAFNGSQVSPQCMGNFEGCYCQPTSNTCGQKQSCDKNGCAGQFFGLTKYPRCSGNFQGCDCLATATTCGQRQSCDLNGCAGAFAGLEVYPQCAGNFVGCDCVPSGKTCGQRQSCDKNGCAGKFNGLQAYPQCSGNFKGCYCSATSATCGSPQSCSLNSCDGALDSQGKAHCMFNFYGCACNGDDTTEPEAGSPTTPPVPDPSPAGPTEFGCVSAHCYVQVDSYVTGDTSLVVQLYQGDGSTADAYLFQLSGGHNYQDPTPYKWTNIQDAYGRTWNVEVDGYCSNMYYASSGQKSYGAIQLSSVRHPSQWTCFTKPGGGVGGLDHQVKCPEVESQYWGSACADGQAAPFCDYKATCDPFRPGTPEYYHM